MTQARYRVMIQFMQAMVGQYPVFAGYGYDVGAYAEAEEVEILKCFFSRYAILQWKCLNEFKTDTAAAEFFIGIVAVASFGI